MEDDVWPVSDEGEAAEDQDAPSDCFGSDEILEAENMMPALISVYMSHFIL